MYYVFVLFNGSFCLVPVRSALKMGYNKRVVVWGFGQQMICWPRTVALGLQPLATVHLQGQQIICCPSSSSG